MRWRANQACQNASRRESAERRAHAASIWETDDAHAERGSRHARTARPRRYLIRILRRHSFAAGVAAGEGDDQTLAPAQARARVHIGRGMHRATRKRGGEGGDGGARGCGAYIHIYILFERERGGLCDEAKMRVGCSRPGHRPRGICGLELITICGGTANAS